MDDKNLSTVHVNRISILLAMISLALAGNFLVPPQSDAARIGIFNFLFELKINRFSLIPVITGILTFFGTSWFLRSDRHSKDEDLVDFGSSLILPVLTVSVLSSVLQLMNRSTVWWIVYFLGVLLLGVVLIAEYAVRNRNSPYFVPAQIGLTALSFTLFFALSVTVRAASLRVYIMLLFIVVAAAFVSYRVVKLRTGQVIPTGTAIIILIIMGQFVIAANYLYINGIQFGLLLTWLLYSLVSLASSLLEARPLKESSREPIAMGLITLILFFVISL